MPLVYSHIYYEYTINSAQLVVLCMRTRSSRLLLAILKAQSEKHRHLYYHKHKVPKQKRACVWCTVHQTCKYLQAPVISPTRLYPNRLTQIIIQREWTQIDSQTTHTHVDSFCFLLLQYTLTLNVKNVTALYRFLITALYIALFLYLHVLVVLYIRWPHCFYLLRSI